MAWTEEYEVNGKTHYRVRYWENGKKRSKTAGPNKTTLKALIKKVEHREILEIPFPLSTAHSIKEYISVKSKEVSPNTLDIARRALNSVGRDFLSKFVHEITPQDIERLKNRLIEFRKPAGVNIVLRNLSTFFGFCLRMGAENGAFAPRSTQIKQKNDEF